VWWIVGGYMTIAGFVACCSLHEQQRNSPDDLDVGDYVAGALYGLLWPILMFIK